MKKKLFGTTSYPVSGQCVRIHVEFSDERRLCCRHWRSETSQVNEYNNIVLNSASNQITTATAKNNS